MKLPIIDEDEVCEPNNLQKTRKSIGQVEWLLLQFIVVLQTGPRDFLRRSSSNIYN